ncbi:MAG TPA: hypothetical protein VHW26_13890 [Solirubrobacteraceae bacterium]|nr:hypothetical protein [Solirubrobacteraceae bacterium]
MATVDVLVDTDVLVDHLRGARRLTADGRRLGMSVVSRCELFAGRGTEDRVRSLLAPMIDLRIDADTGVIRREAGLATPDALIAVTAVRHGIP